MPEQTREFSHFWRTPSWEPELEEQNALLERVLASAQADLPTAKTSAEEVVHLLEGGWGNLPTGIEKIIEDAPDFATVRANINHRYQLIAANVMLRMQLVQVLAYFEGVNELYETCTIQRHPFTLTPNAIRDALESHPTQAPLDRIMPEGS